ncbi:ankyrin repeat domain-containing protein [Comamonadaceae bacterium OH2545_COT-014]|nr:ankyrin repeat domain-containing protein [Comamonadaceae bacterium OH2545_COT-014]
MSIGLTISEILDDFKDYADLTGNVEIQVNTRSKYGDTPLHWMATLGDAIAIEMLIKFGADVNVKNALGNTPLHNAIKSRQVTAVKALLAGGSDCAARNLEGKTPLDVALVERYLPVIDTLRIIAGRDD